MASIYSRPQCVLHKNCIVVIDMLGYVIIHTSALEYEWKNWLTKPTVGNANPWVLSNQIYRIARIKRHHGYNPRNKLRVSWSLLHMKSSILNEQISYIW